MKIEALKGFCGILSMAKGEVREYSDQAVLSDLLKAGYVKEIRHEEEKKTKRSRAPTKKEVIPDEG